MTPLRSLALFRQLPYTCVTLALALTVLVAALFWNINVFELRGADIIGIEQNEAGEIAIAFLLIIPAFFVDRVMVRQRSPTPMAMSQRKHWQSLTRPSETLRCN